ncbi:MAG: hypothetical protein ABI432_11600, partial [Flavobacteriales bacterium]
MLINTMSVPEAITEAKADLPRVQNKMLSLIAEQERRHRKNRRAGDLVLQSNYTSLNNNKWLYVLTTNKKHSLQNFFTWFNAREGITGLQLASEGLHFLYTPHFFTRYRERSGHGAPAAIDNLTTFFFRNPSNTAMRTGKEHLGFPAFIGAVPDGYVLGTLHYDEGYQRCRTFISHDQAFPNQEEQWEGLAAIHELQKRYPKMFAQLK